MDTIYNLLQRAKELKEKSQVESITPEEVGKLHEDTLAYIAALEQSTDGLGIKKVYQSKSVMEEDTDPVGTNGKVLRYGQLVSIYDATHIDSLENGKIYAYQKPGWLLVGKVNSDVIPYIVQETGDSPTKVMSQKAVTEALGKVKVTTDDGKSLQEVYELAQNAAQKEPADPYSVEKKTITTVDLSVNEFVDDNGTIRGSDNIHTHTDKISCKDLASIVGKTMSLNGDTIKLPPVLFFDENNSFITSKPTADSYTSGSNTFKIGSEDIPANASYCCIQGERNVENGTAVELIYHHALQLQIDSLGKEIRSINEKVDDTIRFGNLLKEKDLPSGSFGTKGEFYNGGGWWHSKKFLVKKGMRIVGKNMWSFNSGSLILPAVVFFDVDNHIVGWAGDDGGDKTTFDTAITGKGIPDNAAYFVYNIHFDDNTTRELYIYYNGKDVVKNSIEIEYKEAAGFPNLTTLLPKTIYNVANDVVSGEEQGYSNNQSSAVLYLDNFFYGVKKEFPFTFKNGDTKKIVPFISKGYKTFTTAGILDSTSSHMEETISDGIIGNSSSVQEFSFLHRCVKNSVTAGKAVNILFVGDSITFGQNAYFFDRKELMSYSMILHDMFEIDRINNDNKGFSFRTIGQRKRVHVFNYKKKSKSLETYHEGYEGTHMTATLNSSNKYDLALYLSKYRTCDDDGNRLYFDKQKNTVGVPGDNNIGYLEDGTKSQFKIGSLVSNVMAHDVFKPTHVFLFMGTNGGYTQAQLDGFINGVKEVDESIFVGIGLPHWGGTIFPSKYKNFIDCETWTLGEHESQYKTQALLGAQDRNVYESRGVYFLDTYFVTPGALSAPCGVISEPFTKYDGDFGKIYRPFGQGANVHVSAYAHAAYAYQVYSWIKWTIAKGV